MLFNFPIFTNQGLVIRNLAQTLDISEHSKSGLRHRMLQCRMTCYTYLPKLSPFPSWVTCYTDLLKLSPFPSRVTCYTDLPKLSPFPSWVTCYTDLPKLSPIPSRVTCYTDLPILSPFPSWVTCYTDLPKLSNFPSRVTCEGMDLNSTIAALYGMWFWSCKFSCSFCVTPIAAGVQFRWTVITWATCSSDGLFTNLWKKKIHYFKMSFSV
jgi:hypothetical protein